MNKFRFLALSVGHGKKFLELRLLAGNKFLALSVGGPRKKVGAKSFLNSDYSQAISFLHSVWPTQCVIGSWVAPPPRCRMPGIRFLAPSV